MFPVLYLFLLPDTTIPMPTLVMDWIPCTYTMPYHGGRRILLLLRVEEETVLDSWKILLLHGTSCDYIYTHT